MIAGMYKAGGIKEGDWMIGGGNQEEEEEVTGGHGTHMHSPFFCGFNLRPLHINKGEGLELLKCIVHSA